jgi:hypothetical protein
VTWGNVANNIVVTGVSTHSENLITNGSFDNDVSGWTGIQVNGGGGASILTWNAGTLVMTKGTAGKPMVSQAISVSPNTDYDLSFEFIAFNTSSFLRVGTTIGGGEINEANYGIGVHNTSFNSGSNTTVYIGFYVNDVSGGATLTLDNVSVVPQVGTGHTHVAKIVSGGGSGDIAWDVNVPYSTNDVVNYNGQIYKALQDNTGQYPDVSLSTYWIEVVEKDRLNVRVDDLATVMISASDHLVRIKPPTPMIVEVYMPPLTAVRDGKHIIIKDSYGMATNFNITINPGLSSEFIDESHPGTYTNKYVMDTNKEASGFVANTVDLIWEAI